jgi:hypothetical protein
MSASKEVLIRHGAFHYYVTEKAVRDGEEVDILVEHTAFHNERVNLERDADYERGVEIGAFWNEEEALAHYEEIGVPAPLLGQSPVSLPQPPLESGEEIDADEVEITELDEDDLVDWIMSTGAFDGEKKPTVAEVVAAGDEGGPEFSALLLKAEDRASGGAPRAGVVEGLNTGE